MADRILSAEVNIQVQGATASLDNLAKKVDKSADVVTKSLDEIAVAAKRSQPTVRTELAKTGIEAVKLGDKLDRNLSKGVGGATNALTNLNRVVQDAPFGIIGIANNIDPLVNSFQKLRAESGGTGGAIKALLGTLAGPTGVLFAFSAISTAATVLVQKYGSLGEAYRVLTGQTVALTEEQKKYAEEQQKSAVAVEKQKVELNALVSVARGDVGTKEQQKQALIELNKLIPDNIGLLTSQNIKTAEGTKILQRYTQAVINRAEAELLADRAAELRVSLRTKEKTLYTDLTKEIQKASKAQQQLVSGSSVAGALSGVNVVTQAVTVNKDAVIKGSESYKEYISQYKELAEITARVGQLTAGSVELDFTAPKTTGSIKNSIEKSIEAELQGVEVKKPIETFFTGGVEIATGSLDKLNKSVEQNINTSLAARPLEIKPKLTVLSGIVDSFAIKLGAQIQSALTRFTVDALAGFGDVIGNAIMSGADGFKTAAQAIGGLFSSFLKQLGKIFIETGVIALAGQKALKGLLTNPIAAIGVGVALSALGAIAQSKLAAVQPFANGGIVTGPTLGLVGEAGQPEVILPLSKINQFLDGNGGGGGNLTATITGDQLKFVLDRTTRKQNRLF